jgi:hypothetical protein
VESLQQQHLQNILAAQRQQPQASRPATNSLG